MVGRLRRPNLPEKPDYSSRFPRRFPNLIRLFRTPRSSNVYGFRYDPKQLLLEIRFTNNRIYWYKNITPEMAHDITKSRSQGRWVWYMLRKYPRRYIHRRMR